MDATLQPGYLATLHAALHTSWSVVGHYSCCSRWASFCFPFSLCLHSLFFSLSLSRVLSLFDVSLFLRLSLSAPLSLSLLSLLSVWREELIYLRRTRLVFTIGYPTPFEVCPPAIPNVDGRAAATETCNVVAFLFILEYISRYVYINLNQSYTIKERKNNLNTN